MTEFPDLTPEQRLELAQLIAEKDALTKMVEDATTTYNDDVKAVKQAAQDEVAALTATYEAYINNHNSEITAKNEALKELLTPE